MTTAAVKITRKGQVTIPKAIRDILKANAVYFEVEDDAVMVKPVRDAAGSLREYAGKVKSGVSMKRMKMKPGRRPFVKEPARNLPDTNTIVRYLAADDPALHAKAKLFFDEVKDGSIRAVILESVIAECVYVLTKIYKVPKVRAAESLTDVLRYKGIANDDRQELIRACRCSRSEVLILLIASYSPRQQRAGTTFSHSMPI